MTDTSKCFSLVRGKAMRVTALDGCGNPVLGPDSVAISKGFIQVALTAQIDTGTEINVTNANGDSCVKDTPAPKFTGYTVEVQFCGVNPDLIRLMSGQAMVTDSQTTPQGVGFRMNSDLDLGDLGFALELWSDVPGQDCQGGTNKNYGYFLIPFLQGGVIGDFTVQNDAINFTLSNAATKVGSGWGVGPYNVTRDNSGIAVPLKDEILSGDHLHVEVVTVAPPTAICGATALGVAATGATAGSPGTTTPANSYAPANLAGLTGVTASPNTAWTTGQYITLRDGSLAHWTGSAWAAGAA